MRQPDTRFYDDLAKQTYRRRDVDSDLIFFTNSDHLQKNIFSPAMEICRPENVTTRKFVIQEIVNQDNSQSVNLSTKKSFFPKTIVSS